MGEEKEYLAQFPKGKIPDVLKRNPRLRISEGAVLMNRASETAKAEQLIKKINYITLATANKRGKPWNTPLFYACDKDYNFYWISSPDSVHSANIKENENVSMVIYDSTLPEGSGFGVYIAAKAKVVKDKEEIRKGRDRYTEERESQFHYWMSFWADPLGKFTRRCQKQSG